MGVEVMVIYHDNAGDNSVKKFENQCKGIIKITFWFCPKHLSSQMIISFFSGHARARA